ncbi:dentin sialophosphoprotein-related [Raphanus sativus]|nr:dentin sialophosphoprotein-related [Raphanus sativus]
MFDLDEEELTNMIWGVTVTILFLINSGHSVDPGSRSAAELSKCLAEPARSYSSKTEKTSELWKVPDVFHSTAADEENKERGDFDEYGWANISSFDDLDRMFSNDVPTFGDGSLSGTDELWTSSKNVSSSPSKQLPSMLEPGDLGLDIRTEIEHQENQQFPLTGKANGPPSSQSVGVTQNLSSIIIRSHSQGSGTSNYPHMPNQCMSTTTSGFGNHTNPYSSSFQRPDVKNQHLMHPSYNPATAISPNNASARPSTMTPQEKLEKLRRRQQMQAMLAIQRQQQQQFRHQVPLADQYITQNCCQNNPPQLVDKANLLRLTAMPSFDPSSSLEPGDSGNFADGVGNSSEFSVLYRLQDVVAKLDMGTRTCIRDSLFRLADSAGQRHHYASDKTIQDDQEVAPEEKSRFRYGGMLDTETVTNPTDRTVAHLLFRRPFDMSAAKHMEGGPESPASSKMGTGDKGKFPKCSTRESHINKQRAKEEEPPPAGSLDLGNASNSGSSSTVLVRDVVEASQGN